MSEPNHTDGSCHEDFEVGMVLRHPLGRTVTQTDKIWFTLLTANTNPIHFDAHYAAQTEFGRPLVNSTFTLKTCVKLITLHVRKDRFAGVHFGEMVHSGHIAAILHRLAELRESLAVRP